MSESEQPVESEGPVELPSEGELKTLSREGVVAYAARCAMRVQPLVGANSFGDTDLAAIKERLLAIDIALTESARGLPSAGAGDAATAAYDAAEETNGIDSAYATHAANEAANATSDATRAAVAVLNAAHAAAATGTSAHDTFIYAARDDFKFIHELDQKQMSSHDVFQQSLWPSGEPEAWSELVYYWNEDLLKLGLGDISERYHRQVRGEGIDWGGAKIRVYNWLEKQGVKSDGSPDDSDDTDEVNDSIDKGVDDNREDYVTRQDAVPTHSDEPAFVDLLGRTDFALALTDMIRETFGSDYNNAFLVNINGPWGSGKSSVLNLIQKELTGWDPSTPCDVTVDDALYRRWICKAKRFWQRSQALRHGWTVVWFNAWEHENHESSPMWTLPDEIYKQSTIMKWRSLRWVRAPWIFLREWLWRVANRRGWLIVAASVIILIILYFLHGRLSEVFDSDWLDTLSATIAVLIAITGVVVGVAKSFFSGTAEEAQWFSSAMRNPTRKLTKHFKALVRMIHSPVIIMVDDLDRCREGYVVELLEAVQTLYRHEKVTYVIAADRRWLCASYEKEYATFTKKMNEPGRPLGNLFVEKIFQVSAMIPRLSSGWRRGFWEGLLQTESETVEERMDEYRKEADAEFGEMNSQEEILDRVEVGAVDVVEPGEPVDVERLLRDEARRGAAGRRLLSPEVEKGREHRLLEFERLLDGNPRSMKRLINAYGLQLATAVWSGIDVRSEEIEELALWTILLMRWPLLGEALLDQPGWIVYFGVGGREKYDEMKAAGKLPEGMVALRGLVGDEDVQRVIRGDKYNGREVEITEGLVRLRAMKLVVEEVGG